MSQRRQDARKAQQDRRRKERRDARVQNRRTQATTPAAPASPGAVRPAGARPAGARPLAATATTERKSTQRRNMIIFGGIGGVLLLALIAFLIYDRTRPLPGTHYPTNGNQHVNPGEEHGSYYSNPPTSGWHFETLPDPGTNYTLGNPVLPESLPHFMEHGGVWVLYTCPDGCASDVEALKAVVDDANGRSRPVALAPYPPQGIPVPEHRFNVIAWQYKLGMNEVDAGAIEEFIERHACRYTPEATGRGCTVAKRGDLAPQKDAGENGFKVPSTYGPAQVPGGQEMQRPAAATPAPTTAATATPAPTSTAAASPTVAGPVPPTGVASPTGTAAP